MDRGADNVDTLSQSQKEQSEINSSEAAGGLPFPCDEIAPTEVNPKREILCSDEDIAIPMITPACTVDTNNQNCNKPKYLSTDDLLQDLSAEAPPKSSDNGVDEMVPQMVSSVSQGTIETNPKGHPNACSATEHHRVSDVSQSMPEHLSQLELVQSKAFAPSAPDYKLLGSFRCHPGDIWTSQDPKASGSPQRNTEKSSQPEQDFDEKPEGTDASVSSAGQIIASSESDYAETEADGSQKQDGVNRKLIIGRSDCLFRASKHVKDETIRKNSSSEERFVLNETDALIEKHVDDKVSGDEDETVPSNKLKVTQEFHNEANKYNTQNGSLGHQGEAVQQEPEHFIKNTTPTKQNNRAQVNTVEAPKTPSHSVTSQPGDSRTLNLEQPSKRSLNQLDNSKNTSSLNNPDTLDHKGLHGVSSPSGTREPDVVTPQVASQQQDKRSEPQPQSLTEHKERGSLHCTSADHLKEENIEKRIFNFDLQLLRESTKVTSTEPYHLAEFTATEPYHVDEVTTTESCHIGEVIPSDPYPVAEVTATEPYHVAEATATDPYHVAEVTDTYPYHVAEVTATEPYNFAEVTATEPYHVADVNSTEPYHIAEIISTEPYQVAEVTATEPYHVAEIISTEPYQVAEVTATEPYHVAEITSTEPYHVAEVTATDIYHVAEVTATEPYSIAGVTATEPYHAAEVTATAIYHVAEVTAKEPYHVADVTAIELFHVAKVTATEPYHVAEVTSTEPYYVAEVTSTEPYQVAEVTATEPYNVAEVTSTEPYYVAEVTSTEPYQVAEVTATEPYNVAEVTATEPYNVAEVTATEPYHVAEVTATEPYHAAEVMTGEPYHVAEVTQATSTHVSDFAAATVTHIPDVTAAIPDQVAAANASGHEPSERVPSLSRSWPRCWRDGRDQVRPAPVPCPPCLKLCPRGVGEQNV